MGQLLDYTVRVWYMEPGDHRRRVARLEFSTMPRKEVEYLARKISRLSPKNEVTVTQHEGKQHRTISRLLGGLPISEQPPYGESTHAARTDQTGNGP